MGTRYNNSRHGPGGASSISTNQAGTNIGTENRPRNVAPLYCIKL